MNPIPVPRDIPLPLPAPEPVLVGVLIVFFLMHIVFVNFMVGGALLTLYYEIRGLKEKQASARQPFRHHLRAGACEVDRQAR